MKKSFLFFLFFLSIWPAFSQNRLPDYGEITPADLQMKSCQFEPDAPAMRLIDIQDIHFDLFTYGTKTKTERRIRIKIFNEKGYRFSTIKIPYFSKKGIAKIKEIAGVVYNLGESGKVISKKIDKDDFFKEKAADNIGIVSFTFPNVKPGTVIEYKYTTIENDIIGIDPWIIQGEIPVVYTCLTVHTPVSSGVNAWIFGADSVEQSYYLYKYDQYRCKSFFKNNIPSFSPEPFMSSYNDHLVRVVFSLLPYGNAYYQKKGYDSAMWRIKAEQLLRSNYFHNQKEDSIAGTKHIIDSARKIASLTDRIGFIFETVQKRWTTPPEQTMKAENLSDAWKNHAGTTAEINLILYNLLEKSDIICFPVLISTRNNGIVNKKFPSLGQLNGVDVLAYDTTGGYFLDASNKYQSFKNPPFNILNREVIIINPDTIYWDIVYDPRPLSKQVVNILASLDENGKIQGTTNIQYFDYARSDRLDSSRKEEESAGKEKFLDKNPIGLKIISTKQELTSDPEDPLFETIDFTYELQNTNEFYFINSQLFIQKNQNPFLAEKRNTDIDLGCNQLYMSTMQIDLQGRYEVEHLPKNIVLRAPDSSFFYKAVYSNDAKNIFISQTFEIKRAIFSTKEYPGVQDFFKRMYGLMAEEIILKKKK